MKRYLIIVTLAVFAAVSFSCTKGKQPSGDDPLPHIAPAALVYDEATSHQNGIGLIWDAEPLIDAGAQSFTLELLKDASSSEDVIGKTVEVSAKSRKGSYIFSDLKQYERYYARIRANYSAEESTAWTYVMSGSDIAPIEVGVGIVDRIATWVRPEFRVIRATSGTISVCWSMTGFEEPVLDLTRKARAGLYADAACSNLIVSWDIVKDFFDTELKGGRYGGRYLERQPGFVFTGLEPLHDYWVRIDDITDADAVVEGQAEKVTTEDSSNLMVGTEKVPEGEFILREDFDELLWGGSMMDDAVGYSNKNRGTVSAMVPASGAMGELSSESQADANGYYLVSENIEIGLFTTMKAIVPGTRLADWGYMGGATCCMSGLVKIGGSKNPGKLVTPPLTNLASTATVTLTFLGEPYYIREPRTVQVLIVSGTPNGANNLVSPTAKNARVAATFDLEGGYGATYYSVDLVNVEPGDRIAIGGTLVSDTDTNLRLLLDNLSLSVKKYEVTPIPVDPLFAELATDNGSRGATSSTLTFHWKQSETSTNAEDIAAGYKIYLYKDAACTDLLVSWVIQNGLSTNHTANVNIANRFIFTGLTPETTYWFKAEDLSSGAVSPVISAKTLADPNVQVAAAGTAQPGDVLLFEDFGELLWTGDVVGSACGYTPSNRGLTLVAVTGDNPVGNQTIGGKAYTIQVAEPNDACGLFGTMKSSIPSTRLKNWCLWAQDGNNGRVTNRAGYVQVGNSSKAGAVVTPPLASLSGKAKVKVSFKGATGYGSDHLDMAIYVYREAVTPNASYVVTTKPERVGEPFKVTGAYSWQDFSAEISGVMPDSRIAVGGVETSGYQNRMMVDDIKVELVSYE